MKALPYIFALCCLFSCTKPADVTLQLERAERLMTAHPDSALTLLESIPNPEELSPRDRALWGLLLIQAQDKNHVPYTSDFNLTYSIEYFRTHDDVHRLAWAYYYDGMIHDELEEFELSQASLLKAGEEAIKAEDFDLLDRVHEHLETLYQEQSLRNAILPLHRKALAATVRFGDSLDIGNAYRNIGQYYMNHHLDSAETYLRQASSWLQSKPYQQSHVFNDLARVYRRKKDYEKALTTIRQSLRLFENNAASANPLFLNLADVYARLGKTDSAIVYYQKCLMDAKTRTTAHKRLSEVYHQLGDYQKAYAYGNQYTVLWDSVRQSKHAADLAAQLEKYEKEKAIAQLEREHAESKLYGLAVAMGIIVSLLMVVLAFMVVSRRRKNELLRVSKEMLVTQQKYRQTLTDKEEEIATLTAQLDIQLDDFKQSGLMSSAIYRSLLPLMGEKREKKDYKFLSSKEQDWEKFYLQMDFAYGGIITRLKDEYQLKDDFLKVVCLSLLNVYPCNAKNVYGRTGSAFTNRRTLLAEKFGVSTNELDAFLQALVEEKKE